MKMKIFTPLIFILLLVSLNKAYALDTNKRYLETPMSPQQICKQTDGVLLESVDILDYTTNHTFNSKNVVYSNYTTWVKGSSYNKRLINYLLEGKTVNADEQLAVNYLYDIKESDTGIELKFKSFFCSCSYGYDKFGMCLPKIDYLDVDSTNATTICKNGYDTKGVSATTASSRYFQTTQDNYKTTSNYLFKTWIRGGDNSNNVPYIIKENEMENLLITGNTDPGNEIHRPNTMKLLTENFTCNCPYGKDFLNLCLPFDCTPPEIELSNGVCGLPSSNDFCSDGGIIFNGSCDRSCEQVGKITVNGSSNVFNPSNEKICVDKLDCLQYKNECISKCGNLNNIKNFTCNDSLGVSACQCKDDEVDDIVDDINPDDTTDAGDSLLTNKYLKSIKDEEQKQTQLIDNISSLLSNSNDNDLKRENQLNSINGSLNNIDNSINDGTNRIVNGLNDVENSVNSLKDGQDESNGLLNDIKLSNQGIFDTLSNFIDGITDVEAETFNDEIGDNLSILDNILDEYGTFKDNLTSQYEAVVDMGNNANETINGGFTSIFTNHTSDVTQCMQSFQLDFTSIGASVFNIEIDPCQFTSILKPIFYPIFYIILSISVFSFALSLFRGVL